VSVFTVMMWRTWTHSLSPAAMKHCRSKGLDLSDNSKAGRGERLVGMPTAWEEIVAGSRRERRR